MKSNRLLFLFSALFLIGLSIKTPGIFFEGMFDMKQYSKWGISIFYKGLINTYYGIYFPLQHQIFAFAEWINYKLGFYPDYFISHKIINLGFDIGNLILLVKILKRYSLNILYAHLYWLLPWFLNVFWLGYIDFQFTFFILLFIYLYKDGVTNPLRLVICGLPLAFAFLMKPQVQILFLFLAFYSLVVYYKKRTYIQMLVFLPSVILFGLYSLILGFKVLVHSYLNISNVMPALTANMLNFWYPIAYLIKEPNDPIWIVSDTIISFYNLPVLRIAAVCFILSASFIFIYRLKESQYNILFIFTFGSLMVPFLMTSAHENHLFLGTVLLCLCIPIFSDKSFTLYSLLLISIQQINIFFHYQIGVNKFSVIDVTPYYKWRIDLLLSLVSCILFVAILSFMVKRLCIEFSMKLPAISN